jgi:hypothetical protein
MLTMTLGTYGYGETLEQELIPTLIKLALSSQAMMTSEKL